LALPELVAGIELTREVFFICGCSDMVAGMEEGLTPASKVGGAEDVRVTEESAGGLAVESVFIFAGC